MLFSEDFGSTERINGMVNINMNLNWVKQHVIPSREESPNKSVMFIQGNLSHQIAKLVKGIFEENTEVMKRPAKSPDLNPSNNSRKIRERLRNEIQTL